MEYTIDLSHRPEHTLTPTEESFLNGLAGYKLFLDQSLFFQIDDLQRHTELVLSGERIECDEFPGREDLEQEIDDLYEMVTSLQNRLRQGGLPPKEKRLFKLWEGQLSGLVDAYDKLYIRVPLGVYCHDDGGDSKVVLCVDAIEDFCNEPYQAMLLMGHVLLHEYFHSFYFHTGSGSQYPERCVEEPMAEYGSLVVLDSVAASKETIAPTAKDGLRHALDYVKSRQTCTGTSAVYGFGAHLFEKHQKDFSHLATRYADVSRRLNNRDKEFLEYKYMLYPKYPTSPWIEETAFTKMVTIMEQEGAK